MMASVRLSSVAVAYPPFWLAQTEAARRIGLATGDPRRVAAIARGTLIEKRAVALPPEQIALLGGIEERNNVYQQVAPELAMSAARQAVEQSCGTDRIGQVVAVSCTGYMVPGWDVQLVEELALATGTARLPITQAGCAGGVVAIARARDYVLAHPEQDALVVAAEVCSLAFHASSEPGNLTSALIFGDGAGAALVGTSEASAGPSLEIVDSLSSLVPGTQDALGFALTDNGFLPLLTREIAGLLPVPTQAAVEQLLGRHGLCATDLSFWLVHPGGPRILSAIERQFNLADGGLRWSWQSLREAGNTSSAAIFDVIRRYLADAKAADGWGVVLAFGPGISLELLLVRRC